MTVPEIANRLRDELHFGYPLAFAVAATNGHCAYCGTDLLADPSVGYAVDHLLPKSAYPEYKDVPENWVWSCTGCNAFKSDFDPLLPGQKPIVVLERSRGELVRRAKVRIDSEKAKSERMWWEKAREIVRGMT